MGWGATSHGGRRVKRGNGGWTGHQTAGSRGVSLIFLEPPILRSSLMNSSEILSGTATRRDRVESRSTVKCSFHIGGPADLSVGWSGIRISVARGTKSLDLVSDIPFFIAVDQATHLIARGLQSTELV